MTKPGLLGKIWVVTTLLFSIAMLTPTPAGAAFCACYDPGTGKSTGAKYDTPDGDCTAVTQCNASCSRDCALCQPDGSVDCTNASPAGGSGGGGDFSIENVLERLTQVLNRIIPFLALLATVLLLYGIVRYVGAGDDESKVEEGRRLIFYGIIGLAVMVTVWAFANIVLDFFFETRDFNIPGSDRINTI
ncbi:MAG: hypothetical protein A3C84_00445 [Candidatus Ryanbacteria bacterium RIFCSPHIGHO2_02_FULL_48_12]|uniref:Uncharacterized protein n=1 Tax=Candidatus Ryanbacteria bacterium RIFCSPHIGHO2_01_FULL_48_27 TaxID=1802115 RepID=A0A1G2FZU0_9BACT|nr:MAG: hypothetical protein A2756_04825 [Candidatus Ryanbacteria bacterium RIFCSPHIGHO2_01_FULL_48_27]OGZ50243.1 MAG: hypothetical protein A3C84_00445 [Candidatus Ryanbacteria bacterium RIFCSPHIGHO2_02_FULL_48_12]